MQVKGFTSVYGRVFGVADAGQGHGSSGQQDAPTSLSGNMTEYCLWLLDGLDYKVCMSTLGPTTFSNMLARLIYQLSTQYNTLSPYWPSRLVYGRQSISLSLWLHEKVAKMDTGKTTGWIQHVR